MNGIEGYGCKLSHLFVLNTQFDRSSMLAQKIVWRTRGKVTFQELENEVKGKTPLSKLNGCKNITDFLTENSPVRKSYGFHIREIKQYLVEKPVRISQSH